MSKSIGSYEELLEYELQLNVLLTEQKKLIRYDVLELKEQVMPFAHAAQSATQFFTRSNDHGVLVSVVTELLDFLLRKTVLSRAGRISRLIVPFFAKNISSHLVALGKEGLLKKLMSLVSKKVQTGSEH